MKQIVKVSVAGAPAAALPAALPAATPPTPPTPPTNSSTLPPLEAPSLRQVRTTLQACIGTATLPLAELLAVQPRQVLVLDRPLHHPIDLLLEGQVVARGQLVAEDDRFAVRLTELPGA